MDHHCSITQLSITTVRSDVNNEFIASDEGALQFHAIAFVLLTRPDDAVALAAVADEENGDGKDEAADGAWLTFEEEAHQVQDKEHCMVVKEGWIDRFRDQQNRN